MKLLIPFLLLLNACASTIKCGNPAGANTVYNDSRSCEVRIRQVIIGSKIQIPESLKGPELAGYEMTWVESSLQDGKIQLGHFALIPKSNGTQK